MLTELADACGVKRRKSLRGMFAEAREIDRVFADLGMDLDSGPEADLDKPLLIARKNANGVWEIVPEVTPRQKRRSPASQRERKAA